MLRPIQAAVLLVALASPALAGGLAEIDPALDCAGRLRLDDYFPPEPIVSGRTRWGDEYVAPGMRRALADLSGAESRSARDFFTAARGAAAPSLDRQSPVPMSAWMDRTPMPRSDLSPQSMSESTAIDRLAAAASRPIKRFGITKIVAEPATYAMGAMLLICFGAWLFGRRRKG